MNINKSGFTLLELIVAITILAIITSFIYGVYTGSVKTIDETREKIDIYENGRMVLERMSNELRSTAVPIDKGVAPDVTFFSGTNDEIGSVHADEIQFITRSNATNYRQNGRPILMGVYYFLKTEEDEEGETMKKDTYTLMRSEEPIFSRDFMEDVKEEEFIDGCSGLDFEYYGESGWVDEWDDQDGGDQEGNVPSAIKITLSMKPKNGKEITLTTIVTIPCGK